MCVDSHKRKRLCCHSDDSIDDTLDFNSENYSKIRQDMLDNKPILACGSCYSDEENLIISPRQRALSDIVKRNHSKLLHDQIAKHRSNHSIIPYSYDLRISNNCNLSCQICDADHSSTIAKQMSVNDPYLTYEIDLDINPQSVWIYLAGGEPFLIKRFVSMLEKIQNLNCEIIVNTNGTVVTQSLINQLNRFNNVCITVSIDGVGLLNEQLRRGSSWTAIDKNIDLFKDLGYNLHAQTAVQQDNINDLNDIADYLISKGIENWTLIEVIDPDRFNWKNNTNINKIKIRQLCSMPIIQKNIKSMTFMKHIMTYIDRQ